MTLLLIRNDSPADRVFLVLQGLDKILLVVLCSFDQDISNPRTGDHRTEVGSDYTKDLYIHQGHISNILSRNKYLTGFGGFVMVILDKRLMIEVHAKGSIQGISCGKLASGYSPLPQTCWEDGGNVCGDAPSCL